jgi:TRAP-type C4-dicarboxylate transport system substrate-binding protein
MAFPELYSALQQRVVDGQENPYTMPWGFKLYEVQKYLSKTGHQLMTHTVLFSKKIWDKLPGDIQAKLVEAANEAKDYERDRCVRRRRLKRISREGWLVFNEVDQDALQAVEPLYECSQGISHGQLHQAHPGDQ